MSTKKIQKVTLWQVLGFVLLLAVGVQGINMINSNTFAGVNLFDLFLNLAISILLFMQSALGLFILTFALILGIGVSVSKGPDISLVFQILLLIASFPLWIQKFSSKK